MRTNLRAAAIVACFLTTHTDSARTAETEPRIDFEQQRDQLVINVDGRPLTTYLLRHDKLTRPAFVNVHTPGGTQVTRNFPPRLPEDLNPGKTGEGGIDHAVMHAGIWIAFGNLHGQDYFLNVMKSSRNT